MGVGYYEYFMALPDEIFSRYCPFVRGIHRSPVDSPHKGAIKMTFDASLLSV